MGLSVFPETLEIFSQPILGKVEETITTGRSGRVSAMATTWPAEFYSSDCQLVASPGDPVVVIGRRGITLLVLPA
jgi:membrane protein implicated in regulation of membrane protease activity